MSNNEKDVIIIEPGRAEKNYWRDLWRYRELFYFLSWRDILVRYKQTVIGIAWSVIRPVLTMVVFTIIFGKIAKLPSGNVPYPIMVFTALLPWQFFASALQDSSNSLIGNANMISKVYFPRMIVPASSIIVAFVDFLVSFILLALLMVWYRFVPSYKIIFIPLFLLMALIFSFGAGLLISALNVKYRDFKYIVPFIVQFGLYVSPVGFSSNVVPVKWRFLYSLNPMVGVIDGFRWAILGKGIDFYFTGFTLSIILIFITLAIGIWYFRKTEKTFADRI
ncbi:MAG: ABC transporter permease [Actinobacteria bacterium]|nr:ABC transporter permease [Cyanobacteriota bacterium]MCL5771852.1 ABC transporter permease [Actinomycetota bacterium]